MLFLVLDPLALMVIMYLFARHETKASYLKAIVLCFILSVLVQGSFNFIGFASLLIYAALLPVALVQFCHLRWKIAGLVCAVFLVVKMILLFALIFLLYR